MLSEAGPVIPPAQYIDIATETGSPAFTFLLLALSIWLLLNLCQLKCSCGCKVTWTRELIQLKTPRFHLYFLPGLFSACSVPWFGLGFCFAWTCAMVREEKGPEDKWMSMSREKVAVPFYMFLNYL